MLPVIWFHSGLPGLPGGFTGVDTFFVISGYLITLIIHREVVADRFTFRRFYERRIRRIAPALLAVLSVSFMAAVILLLPYELVDFSWSALAALGMSSNVYFWRTGNYFSLSEAVTPLLHTWSLGVEEQFYLLFPVALILAERRGWTKALVGTGLVTSFGLCMWLTATSPAAAFYLLPTRGWELMLGAAIAVGLVAIRRDFMPIVGLVGMVSLLAACLFITVDDPFPGWWAALPAIGAASIILAGGETFVGRALSVRPLVYVGKISYSLYLWHWPVFAFLRHYLADTTLSPEIAFGGIALTFLLSVATYRLVEQPARQRAVRYRTILLASGSAAAALALVAFLSLATAGWPQRLPPRVVAIASGHEAYAPLARACTDVGFESAKRDCLVGPPGPTRFVLWGDSHAAAVSEGVALGIDKPGIVFSSGNCPPGWVDPRLKGRDPGLCRDMNRKVLGLIQRDKRIETVVLSAFWDEHSGPDFWRSMQATVDELRGKRIIVLAGIPHAEVDIPWASAINARFGRETVKLDCAPARIPLRGVEVADVSQGFCRGTPAWCLFTDSNHVSREAGLRIIAPMVQKGTASEK